MSHTFLHVLIQLGPFIRLGSGQDVFLLVPKRKYGARWLDVFAEDKADQDIKATDGKK